MDTSMSTGLIAMHWYPKETIKNNQYKREKIMPHHLWRDVNNKLRRWHRENVHEDIVSGKDASESTK